jgi:hypothetical protein
MHQKARIEYHLQGCLEEVEEAEYQVSRDRLVGNCTGPSPYFQGDFEASAGAAVIEGPQ